MVAGEQRVAGGDEQRGVVDAGQALGENLRVFGRGEGAAATGAVDQWDGDAVDDVALLRVGRGRAEHVEHRRYRRHRLLGPADVEAALEDVDHVVLVLGVRRQAVPALNEAPLAGLRRFVDDRDAEAIVIRATRGEERDGDRVAPEPGGTGLDVLAGRGVYGTR